MGSTSNLTRDDWPLLLAHIQEETDIEAETIPEAMGLMIHRIKKLESRLMASDDELIFYKNLYKGKERQ